ncbi:putative reverse transcriptase domain-containing protein [Tanacetum coccineum]
MPSMMTTRNVGRRTTASRGGRTGGQIGRGGGRTREQTGRGDGRTGITQQLQDLLLTIITQVGDHISNQRINGSQNDNAADDSIHEDVRNVNVSNGRNGCSYKEFVACRPKEFDGKGGAIAYTRWVEKMEAVQDINVRNGSLKKSGGKESWRKRHFAKDCRAGPKMITLLNARNPTVARGACYEYGGTDHYKSACPRLNRAPGQGGNRPNQALAIEGGQGRGNNGNPTTGRAFVIGVEEARQDSNIMMDTFSLNNHYATMLFDSGANYSFVSTTFMPLLDIKPSSLGFSYEIEIASRQLVEIKKVIRSCKLELEGHTFDIDLILFGHGSFDVYGERPKEKVKRLMSAKAEEPKLEDIAII